MQVMINGKPETIERGETVSELLERLDIPSAGTAVAIGDSIVSREAHATRRISEGERVEIIRAIGGG
jgi:sulfur carrier protein